MNDRIKQLAALANYLSNTGESDGEDLLLSAIEELEALAMNQAKLELAITYALGCSVLMDDVRTVLERAMGQDT